MADNAGESPKVCYSCFDDILDTDPYGETLCGTLYCKSCIEENYTCKCEEFDAHKNCRLYRYTPQQTYVYKCNDCQMELPPDKLYMDHSFKSLYCESCESKFYKYSIKLTDMPGNISISNHRTVSHMNMRLFERCKPMLAQICTTGVLKYQFDVYSKNIQMFKTCCQFTDLTYYGYMRKPGTMSQDSYLSYLKFCYGALYEFRDKTLENYEYLYIAVYYCDDDNVQMMSMSNPRDLFDFDIWKRYRLCAMYSQSLITRLRPGNN